MLIAPKSPLVDFTKILTQLDYKVVETYHRYEVPKKGKAKNNHLPCPKQY